MLTQQDKMKTQQKDKMNLVRHLMNFQMMLSSNSSTLHLIEAIFVKIIYSHYNADK